MSLLTSIQLPYVASGLVVGILVGATGVGGGSLMTPLLILVFGIDPATAVGTDLLFAASTKAAGTLMHGFLRTIDWRVVGLLAAGSVPATVLTLLALSMIDIKSLQAQRAITMSLAGVLLLTSIALVFTKQILSRYADCAQTIDRKWTSLFTVALGVLVGFLVTSTSVGAGAIGVTVLVLLYPGFPTARIVGSDIAHAVPLTLLAGSGHWLLGSVDWRLLLPLIIGSIPGILAGSYFAGRAADHVLRLLLAAVLSLVAIKLVA